MARQRFAQIEEEQIDEEQEEHSVSSILLPSLDRQGAVREDINAIKRRIESDYLTLAELLTETRDNVYYKEWGFRTFPEYCNEELNIQPRKVQYMISIFEAIRDLGLSDKRDTIQEIGWTKMRMLVGPMRQAEEEGRDSEIDALLSRAEASTAKSLQDYVKDASLLERAARSDGKVGISFRTDENTASIIFDAIDVAKSELEIKESGTDKALEHICYDYVQRSGSAGSRVELSDVLRWVNSTYGTDIQMPDTDITNVFENMEE